MMHRLLVPALLTLGLSSPARAEEVAVFAAASLTDVLTELGQRFEGATGHEVVFNFGASSDLARQIRAGARADVFFSADLARMEELEKAGLVAPGARRDVLSNLLAVVVPRDAPLRLERPSDLLRVRRLALANPEAVPAGIYARRYLESLGLWDSLRARVVPTLDVRAALSAVGAGHVDAGIVYRTDAAISPRVKVAFEVPRERGPSIAYPLAPLASSPKPATRALVDYLLSPEARAVYERYGFQVVLRP